METLPWANLAELSDHLHETFFRIMPSGETARSLLKSIPIIVHMAADGSRGDELRVEVSRSASARSKLLLLISMTRQKLIRDALEALEDASLPNDAVPPSAVENARVSLVDRLDGVITEILKWKRPVSMSFRDWELDPRTHRSARNHGCSGVSRQLRW